LIAHELRLSKVYVRLCRFSRQRKYLYFLAHERIAVLAEIDKVQVVLFLGRYIPEKMAVEFQAAESS
jgi:hypothetical protein